MALAVYSSMYSNATRTSVCFFASGFPLISAHFRFCCCCGFGCFFDGALFWHVVPHVGRAIFRFNLFLSHPSSHVRVRAGELA